MPGGENHAKGNRVPERLDILHACWFCLPGIFINFVILVVGIYIEQPGMSRKFRSKGRKATDPVK